MKMLLDDVLAQFRAAVKTRNEAELLEIAEGKASDHTDYKRRCALIQGRRQALEILTETLKKFNEDEGDF